MSSNKSDEFCSMKALFKRRFRQRRLRCLSSLLGTSRQVTTVACDGWIDVTSSKTRVTFYRRPSGTVCFRRVSRREDNGETDKSSCIRIVAFLLKLSSQWVKYVLACVYIDLAIGEMKKKAKMSEFRLSSRLRGDCLFFS